MALSVLPSAIIWSSAALTSGNEAMAKLGAPAGKAGAEACGAGASGVGEEDPERAVTPASA